MSKIFQRIVLPFLLIIMGIGIFGNTEVSATDGSFDIPKIDDQFIDVEKAPEPKKLEPITPKPVPPKPVTNKKEKGIIEKTTDFLFGGWDEHSSNNYP
jgi:hypothetical protein